MKYYDWVWHCDTKYYWFESITEKKEILASRDIVCKTRKNIDKNSTGITIREKGIDNY